MENNESEATVENNEHVKTLSETLRENQHNLPSKPESKQKNVKARKFFIICVALAALLSSLFLIYNVNRTNVTKIEQTNSNSQNENYTSITLEKASNYIKETTAKSQQEYNKKGGLLDYEIKNPATGMTQEIYYHYAPEILEGLAVTYNTKNKTDFTIESHDENTDIFGLKSMKFDIYTSAYLSQNGIILQSTDKLYKYELQVDKEGLVTKAIREETVGNVENYKTASVTMEITYGASPTDEEIIKTSTQ